MPSGMYEGVREVKAVAPLSGAEVAGVDLLRVRDTRSEIGLNVFNGLKDDGTTVHLSKERAIELRNLLTREIRRMV